MPRRSPSTLSGQVADSIRRIGVRRTGAVAVSRLADYLFDLRYGTDTVQTVEVDELDVNGVRREQAQRYQPTGSLPFGRLMKLYRFPRESVLVDFGCGKGRVLLMGMLHGFRKVIGVEFSADLCRVARANVDGLRARGHGEASAAEVLHMDAAQYACSGEETIFYFFHPFDDALLGRILDRIHASLEARPRQAWIVYYLPVHAAALEARIPKFRLLGEHLLSGYECKVYGTAPVDRRPGL
jgi:hypothetical protein